MKEEEDDPNRTTGSEQNPKNAEGRASSEAYNPFEPTTNSPRASPEPDSYDPFEPITKSPSPGRRSPRRGGDDIANALEGLDEIGIDEVEDMEE